MKYLIHGIDAPNSLPKRLAVRAEHLARLHALQAVGRLLLAGPIPAIDSATPGDAGYLGSMVVAEFDSQSSAEEWANKDPYLLSGAWIKAIVQPFIQVLP